MYSALNRTSRSSLVPAAGAEIDGDVDRLGGEDRGRVVGALVVRHAGLEQPHGPIVTDARSSLKSAPDRPAAAMTGPSSESPP